MNTELGAPISLLKKDEKERIMYIVSDVDDTITHKGRLLPLSLQTLYDLKESGKNIILVTGGSAGWADVYIRQWPIDYVITESGALLLYKKDDGDIAYITNPKIDQGNVHEKRRELIELTKDYPLSSDQYARIYDIAYDKRTLDTKDVEHLKDVVRSFGANYAESSIHLNVWFGDYDKAKGIKEFLPYITDEDISSFIDHSVYLGDSFNDQIMFYLFPISIGMQSVEDNRSKFKILPKYITEGYGGYGVYEASKILI